MKRAVYDVRRNRWSCLATESEGTTVPTAAPASVFVPAKQAYKAYAAKSANKQFVSMD